MSNLKKRKKIDRAIKFNQKFKLNAEEIVFLFEELARLTSVAIFSRFRGR